MASSSDIIILSFVIYSQLGILVAVRLLQKRRRTARGRPLTVGEASSLVLFLFGTLLLLLKHFIWDGVNLLEFALGLLLYAAGLFVIISEFMVDGLARRLTAWRGKKWIKEIDYVYLSLAAIGVALSLDRIQPHWDASKMGLLGPLVVSTALVLRAIKTRAEIEGWADQE